MLEYLKKTRVLKTVKRITLAIIYGLEVLDILTAYEKGKITGEEYEKEMTRILNNYRRATS